MPGSPISGSQVFKAFIAVAFSQNTVSSSVFLPLYFSYGIYEKYGERMNGI